MKIISLDLSTKSTGYAVFLDNKLIDYGCITASSSDVIKRIEKIIAGLHEVLVNHIDYDKLYIEEVLPEGAKGNIKTHKALMWLQAALAFEIHKFRQYEKLNFVYPSEWRSQCGIQTGRGIKRETLKAADIAFVKDKFGIDVNDDIADAICIGYASLMDEKSDWGLF